VTSSLRHVPRNVIFTRELEELYGFTFHFVVLVLVLLVVLLLLLLLLLVVRIAIHWSN
jgi:hypothetical protein